MLKAGVVEEFVRKDYEAKDIMHDLSHIRRVLRIAQKLAQDYNCDSELLMLGAYFHGIVYDKEHDISEFLNDKSVSKDRAEKAIQIARESQKESEPETIEGTILHDAHLIEGGKTFLVVKSLITGTIRGQTLEQTISFVEKICWESFAAIYPKRRQSTKKRKDLHQISWLSLKLIYSPGRT